MIAVYTVPKMQLFAALRRLLGNLNTRPVLTRGRILAMRCRDALLQQRVSTAARSRNILIPRLLRVQVPSRKVVNRRVQALPKAMRPQMDHLLLKVPHDRYQLRL
jgi:hypothetical protein